MKKNEREKYRLPDGRVMPLDNLKWIHRSELRPNHYNPNSVAPPEMKLLKTSIMEDGWTQPVVANPDGTIVDGFHRWTTSGDPEVYAMTDGFIPVVVLEPKDLEHQQMSTIRHNRARGRHGVLEMGRIVKALLDEGLSVKEVCTRLSMEREEVMRLTNSQGVMGHPDLDKPYSKAWEPE